MAGVEPASRRHDSPAVGDGSPLPEERSQARRRARLGGVARGGALGLLGAGASAGAGVAIVLVLAATLPAADAGVFFAVTSVFLLCQAVAKLGTNTGLVYFIARLRSLGTPERIAACVRVAFVPVIVAGVLLGVALYAVAPWLTEVVLGAPSSSAQAALRVLAVLVPVAAVADAAVSATRGFDTMAPTVALDWVGRSLLQVAAVALVVLLGWRSVAVVAAAWALPYLLPALVGSRDLLRRVRETAPESAAAPTPSMTSQFWRFTGPRALASVAQIALQRLDIVLVAAFIGPVAAAVYTAATRVLVVGQLSNQAISNAVQPRLGELLARHDVTATKSAYRAATAWLILLNWPLYLVFALFAPFLLGVLGPEYVEGRGVVIILAVAMLLASACGMVNLVLIMAGRTSWNLTNALLALAVNVALNLVLIPAIGIAGAALAWAAAIAVSNLTALVQIYRLEGLHPFGRESALAMGLALVSFGALPSAAAIAFGGGAGSLAGSTAAGAAVYVLGCHRWRHALSLDLLRTRGRPQ